ncbi:MAG: DUF4177 domain-containing protein [Alphaproteobacteria bacterium]|nr:DUF4177 domain-containing protein [Alphaproteobacteria bacterium]
MRYEYKTVPAPTRAVRVSGVKGAQARFLHALTAQMNELGRDGWEYQGLDTLTYEERRTFGKARSSEVDVMIFRRTVGESAQTENTPRVTGDGREAPAVKPAVDHAAPRLGSASKDVPPASERSRNLAAE